MRISPFYKVFAGHWDWFTFKPGVGYIPTDKAPKEAVEAMEKYNAEQKMFHEMGRTD